MAVRRTVQYTCDGCGEFAAEDKITVVRVGTIEDRPEDCERLDIGPECMTRPLQEILRGHALADASVPG